MNDDLACLWNIHIKNSFSIDLLEVMLGSKGGDKPSYVSRLLCAGHEGRVAYHTVANPPSRDVRTIKTLARSFPRSLVSTHFDGCRTWFAQAGCHESVTLRFVYIC